MVRYYVRESPGKPIQGPYGVSEMRELLKAGFLTAGAQAVEARGQNHFQLSASDEWQAIGLLLGASPEGEIRAEGVPGEPGNTPPPWLAGKVLVRALFVTAVVLVVFAVPLSELLVPKYQLNGVQVHAWSPDAAKALVEMLRLLGVLVFVAALVERVILAFKPASSGKGD